MDPLTMWTAGIVVVSVVGGTFKYFAAGLEKELEKLDTKLNIKIDRDEFHRMVTRQDKDIETLRAEQKLGHERLYNELKDFRKEALEAIADIRNRK